MNTPYHFNQAEALSRLGNDKALLTHIVKIFLSELPAYLDELYQASISREPQTIAKAAHRLKGACATIGIESGAKLALTLEKAGKNAESIEELIKLSENLKDHMNQQAKPSLEEWLLNR